MGTKVLIGSDFSKSSTIAILVGLEWAKIFKCTPIIQHAEDLKEEKKEIILGLKERLREQVETVLNDKKILERCEVVFGEDRHEILIQQVKKHNAKILVLGTRGEGNIRDFFLGGTTDRAIRGIQVPILAVKDEKAARPKNIFWALDFGKIGEFTFEWVKIIGGLFGSSITIGVVIDPRYYDEKSKGTDIDKMMDEDAKEKVELYYNELRREGMTVHVRIRPNNLNNIPSTLGDLIDETNTDLVIMGSAAKKGLKRIVFGSVSESVLKRVNRSIFIVKNPI